VSSRKRRQLSLPDKGPKGQAVVDRLLERVSEPEFCEHNPDGFALWMSTRPGDLRRWFCYQAAQVLAENVSARPAASRPESRLRTRSWC